MVSNFDIVVGSAWSNDPESYAGGSAAIGWASHAGQVKGDDPNKKGYPGPPGWGVGHEYYNGNPETYALLRRLQFFFIIFVFPCIIIYGFTRTSLMQIV